MKVKTPYLYVLAAVLGTVAFLLLPHSVYAQQQASLVDQVPQGFRDDPYVLELVQVINLWNSGDLKMPPREAVIEQLQRRVGAVAKVRRYSYQSDAWAQAMVKQASALPGTLERKARISDPAALVLIALFIKDLDQYKKEVPLNGVEEQLQAPLFLILARAQLLANQAQIDAATMTRSVFSWWTAVWPFCDK